MKKSVVFFGLLIGLAVFFSCETEKKVSIVGSYDLSRSEYYFDGKALDYHSSVIGICDSAARKPVLLRDYDVNWTFYEDGSGIYCAYDSLYYPFTYTLKDNQVTLSSGDEEDGGSGEYETAVTSVFTFENGTFRVTDTYTGIHGWAKGDNRDEVFGLDGKKNHKLEVVNYYRKILKE